MNKTLFTLALAMAGSAHAATPLLNEIYVNNPGADGSNIEYIELVGGAGQSLSGLSILEIEGDSTGAGLIDRYSDLGNFSLGSNGLLLLQRSSTSAWSLAAATTYVDASTHPASGSVQTLENGSISFLLVSNFTGALNGDLDTDNDGVFDSTPWTNVVDSVGWSDGGSGDHVYSPALLTQSSGTPDAASRFAGNMAANNSAAWYAGDILDEAVDVNYDPTKASANFPAGGMLTPGTANVPAVPEPETYALFLAGLGLVGFMARRRKD